MKLKPWHVKAAVGLLAGSALYIWWNSDAPKHGHPPHDNEPDPVKPKQNPKREALKKFQQGTPGGRWPTLQKHWIGVDYAYTQVPGAKPGKMRYHRGIDLGRGATTKDPVFAVNAGRVIWSTHFRPLLYFFGAHVLIEEDVSPKRWSLYAHLSKRHVKKGERVTKGQIIGRIGATGVKSGAVHLHYERWKRMWNLRKNDDHHIDPIPELTENVPSPLYRGSAIRRVAA